VGVPTTIATPLRERREALGVTRLQLAVKSGVSMTWLACLEAGMRPAGTALARVDRALDELEQQEAAA
jgi:predicted transcriptional regulator